MTPSLGWGHTDSNIAITDLDPGRVKTVYKKDGVQFIINGAQGDEAQVTVLDKKTGKVVLEQEMELNPNSSYFTIRQVDLAPGTYIIQFTSETMKAETTFKMR